MNIESLLNSGISIRDVTISYINETIPVIQKLENQLWFRTIHGGLSSGSSIYSQEFPSDMVLTHNQHFELADRYTQAGGHAYTIERDESGVPFLKTPNGLKPLANVTLNNLIRGTYS